MVRSGRLAGVYNLVVADEYDLFDHRVPVETFASMLEGNEVPGELCVIGLAGAYGDDDVSELRRLMHEAAAGLVSLNPISTIEFAIDGAFHPLSLDVERRTEYEV